MNSILLNNNQFTFTATNLPLLIHGKDKAGASLFTVTVAADLFSQGYKMLILSGYHMARDEFYQQVKGLPFQENILFYTKEESNLFLGALDQPDIQERIIIIKNIELFPEEIVDRILLFSKIIISGDINQCTFKDKVLKQNYQSKVLFSQLGNNPLPDLEKYQGYLESDKEGVVIVKF